jgi:hypothetical protein
MTSSPRVVDLSQSGAAIGISPDLRPPVGVVVTIGKTQGRIEDGFPIEFMRRQQPDFVEDNVTWRITSPFRKFCPPIFCQ